MKISLRRLVELAIIKYRLMEESRNDTKDAPIIGNLLPNFRSTKLHKFQALIENKESTDEEIAAKILELQKDSSLGKKSKALTDLLSLAAESVLNKEVIAFQEHIDDLTDMKFEDNVAFDRAFHNVLLQHTYRFVIERLPNEARSASEVEMRLQKQSALIAKLSSEKKHYKSVTQELDGLCHRLAAGKNYYREINYSLNDLVTRRNKLLVKKRHQELQKLEVYKDLEQDIRILQDEQEKASEHVNYLKGIINELAMQLELKDARVQSQHEIMQILAARVEGQEGLIQAMDAYAGRLQQELVDAENVVGSQEASLVVKDMQLSIAEKREDELSDELDDVTEEAKKEQANLRQQRYQAKLNAYEKVKHVVMKQGREMSAIIADNVNLHRDNVAKYKDNVNLHHDNSYLRNVANYQHEKLTELNTKNVELNAKNVKYQSFFKMQKHPLVIKAQQEEAERDFEKQMNESASFTV